MDFQNMFQRGERIGQTTLSCYCYYGDEHGKYPLHCHSYYEISYIFSGSRTETINDNHCELSENSLLFIPPLTIHDLHNDTPVKDVVIQFSHNFIKNIAPTFDDQHMLVPVYKHENSFHFQGSEKIRQIFNALFEVTSEYDKKYPDDDLKINRTFTDKFVFEMQITELCIKLLLALLDEGLIMLVSNSANYEEVERLGPVINELLMHPEQNLDMHKAAKMVGMSYSHFSRVFPKITGFHYSFFCNQLRVRKAEELLVTTDMSITDICGAIGVETLPYFTRLFTQYTGMSPSKYRAEYRK